MKTTVYIAVQGSNKATIAEIKSWFGKVHSNEVDFVLPTKGYQEGWDRTMPTYKHRQAFQLLQGAEDCNGMFKKGADYIIVQHNDPAVIAYATKIILNSGAKTHLIFYSGNNEFSELV